MSAFGGKADVRGTLLNVCFGQRTRRLTEGFRRQRMAEQREENKKIARLAEVAFLRFQFQCRGVPGGSICRFTSTLAAVAAWITA